jgi:hypothetical protein
MSTPKCIELTGVFDDGTVMRLSGPCAELSGRSFLPLPDGVFSRPLRKVTEIIGRYDFGDYDEEDAIKANVVPGEHFARCAGLRDIIPDRLDGCDANGCNCKRAPLMRYRFIVEAVPVKEGE